MKYSPRHNSLKKIQTMIVPISVILFLGLVFLFSFRTFRTRNLECFTQFGLCPESFKSALSGLTGYPLLMPLPQTMVRQKLKKFPEISSIRLYRRLPYTLVAAIALRHPLGLVSDSVLGAGVMVDDQGIVYKMVADSNLPLLLLPQPPSLLSQLPPAAKSSLNILNSLSNLSPSRLTATLSGNLLTVNFSNLSVLIDATSEVSDWYPSLQLILNRSKMTPKVPHKIDLRFSIPVVTY